MKGTAVVKIRGFIALIQLLSPPDELSELFRSTIDQLAYLLGFNGIRKSTTDVKIIYKQAS